MVVWVRLTLAHLRRRVGSECQSCDVALRDFW